MRKLLIALLVLVTTTGFAQNTTLGNKTNTVRVLGNFRADSNLTLIKTKDNTQSDTTYKPLVIHPTTGLVKRSLYWPKSIDIETILDSMRLYFENGAANLTEGDSIFFYPSDPFVTIVRAKTVLYGTGLVRDPTKNSDSTFGGKVDFNVVTSRAKSQTDSSTLSAAMWSVLGTANTTSGTNFIGTTDNKSLSLRTNNILRATLDSNGQFGVGVTPAFKMHVSGDFTLTDTARRGNAYSTGAINTIFPFNIRRNTVTANGNQFPFGPAAYIENTHYGDIGTTYWGVNSVTPQRAVLQLRDRIALNNGTYTFINGVNTQSNSLMIHSQIGSNNNSATPLIINTGTSISTGQNTVWVRTDYWPGNDNGTTVKTYNGWYSMYGGLYDMGGGIGSTLQRIQYYNAGEFKDVQNFVIDTVIGMYIKKMKGLHAGQNINKGFGILQEGNNDENHFAGPVLIYDSLKVQGLKLYSPMGTPALLVFATDSVRTNYYKYINTGAAITLNLPNPTTVANREHLIINQGTAVITFNYPVWLDAATSISTLDYGYPDNAIKVFSDGTKWIGYK